MTGGEPIGQLPLPGMSPTNGINKDPFHQGPPVRVRNWDALWASVWPSIKFLFETEIHVYCFAVAANVLLSFFPFLVVMVMFCKSVLHWQLAVDVIYNSINDYFPEKFGVPFQSYLAAAAAGRKFSWISLLLLFFTANGIFEPLEVALNRIWRAKTNRTFLKNQLISLGMIFACGALFLISISITAMNVQFLTSTYGTSHIGAVIQLIAFKIVAVPITMLILFLIYWLLPNCKIPVRRLVPVSVIVGVLLEVLKYVNILTWPLLRAKLSNEVPPFVQSISIILWSFLGGMLLLAGAEWSARVIVDKLDDANGSKQLQ